MRGLDLLCSMTNETTDVETQTADVKSAEIFLQNLKKLQKTNRIQRRTIDALKEEAFALKENLEMLKKKRAGLIGEPTECFVLPPSPVNFPFDLEEKEIFSPVKKEKTTQSHQEKFDQKMTINLRRARIIKKLTLKNQQLRTEFSELKQQTSALKSDKKLHANTDYVETHIKSPVMPQLKLPQESFFRKSFDSRVKLITVSDSSEDDVSGQTTARRNAIVEPVAATSFYGRHLVALHRFRLNPLPGGTGTKANLAPVHQPVKI